MKTLLLTQKDIASILAPDLANDTVEKAFRAYGLGLTDMPAKSYLYFPAGDLRSMPAYVHDEDFDIAGIKSVTVHPNNADFHLPSVMAVIILNDPQTGFPLAVLDGTYITGIRTGAAGAIAAKYLSRVDSEVAGFVGCGAQGRTQLSCLLEVRKIRKIKIWQFSDDKTCADNFKRWAEAAYDLETIISPEIDEVTLHTDIVITTTPSRSPLVHQVSPGTHINAIGADAPGKQEIIADILKKAKVVIDDWTQAAHSGEINVPLKRKQISKKHVYGQLGAIIAGEKNGRTSDDEITLFDSTGLAIQDITCAWVVYSALRKKRKISSIKFF